MNQVNQVLEKNCSNTVLLHKQMSVHEELFTNHGKKVTLLILKLVNSDIFFKHLQTI